MGIGSVDSSFIRIAIGEFPLWGRGGGGQLLSDTAYILLSFEILQNTPMRGSIYICK